MSISVPRTCALVAWLVAAAAARARGETPSSGSSPGYSSVVRGAPPEAFVTVIPVDEPSARVASVADLVAEHAGVYVRSRGGLGAFTSVSIRGSDDSEVAILVDGVPLPRAATGGIDLGQLGAAGLERIEIYRGVPPVGFGAEAIGGAINLVTRKGALRPSLRAALGGGSFGARLAQAGWSGPAGGIRVDLGASYQGATGDFSYYDTAGTLLNQSDDRRTVRRNNGFDQGALDLALDGARWHLGVHGFIKRQGVPGPGLAGAETTQAKLTTGRLLVDGHTGVETGALPWRVGLSLAYERAAFANPRGELAGPFGPNVSESEALAAGADARLGVAWGRLQRWTFGGDLRVEERLPHDLLYPAQSGAPSTRLLGGVHVSDELRLVRARLVLTPALRLDGAWSRLSPSATVPLRDRGDFFPSPRLTARLELGAGFRLRGSAGRFVRFPTLLELFGDGAFVLPRPLLRPESAWGGDAGLAFARRLGPLDLQLEAAFFGRAVDDAIAFVAGGNASSAINVGAARMLGGELRGDGSLGRWLHASLEYTALAATLADTGKQLPGRPQHEVSLHVDVRPEPFALFYELSYVGVVYRDPQNLAAIPARTLHAVGVSFEHRHVRLAVEVRNLADLRVVALPLGGSAQAGHTVPAPLADFFNYPLPGRALYLTLTLRQ